LTHKTEAAFSLPWAV